MRVLLVDDEVTIFVTLRDALEEAGHQVAGATDTRSALEALEESPGPELVITDIRMPGEGGMKVLQRSIELDPERPVLLMTGFGTIDQAVEAMQIGAVDYIQKPFRNDSVVNRISTFARVRDLEAENKALRKELTATQGFEGIVGSSKPMQKVFDRIRTVAGSDATVMIEGESGTGKERIALALHAASLRKDGPFIAISCAALPENLLEAELFGHEKGAFTDARKERKGRFELADGGTLFLDDIDDMPLATQVKLLRVLQERSFERLGGESTRTIDIRVVVATKIALRQLVREGKFRDDLFYRVNVVPVQLPALRERTDDIPALVQFLCERHGGGKAFKTSRKVLRMLERYPWPGNVRELENAIQRAIALSGSSNELDAEDLLPQDSRWRGATEVPETVRPLREVLREAENEHVVHVLELTGGHKSQTADLLGISRKVLWEKLKEAGLDTGSSDG
ncbi:MAG: DNA-binding NtrC family response regulator [Planctomycetota bacterium]|jgi:DNA-binding NtrC family response regulator